jgi:hypothetical protein
VWDNKRERAALTSGGFLQLLDPCWEGTAMPDDSVHRLLAGILAVVGLLAALPAAFIYVASVLAGFTVPTDGEFAIPLFAAIFLGGFGVGCLWFARGLWRKANLGPLIVQSWALASFVVVVAWVLSFVVLLIYAELLREEGPVFY